MGAIAGIFTRETDNTKQLLEDMLTAMRHRGSQMRASVTGTPDGCMIGIGYCDHQNPDPHVAESSGDILAVDGTLFREPKRTQAEYILGTLTTKSSLRLTASNLMNEPGIFSVLYSHRSHLYAFRDPTGFKPLFCARNRRLVAYASERKALWKIGLMNVQRVLPSLLLAAGPRTVSKSILPHFSRTSSDKTLTMSTAAIRLKELLEESIRRLTRFESKVAVAFSGGLDSSLTAVLAKQIGVPVELIAVGLKNSSESMSAETYAKQLDLPLSLQIFDPSSLDAYVRRLIWLIEEPNLMKVSIAIPLHWAAEAAAKRGHKVMLCGQGSDELYGGYAKYARTLDRLGRRALESELYRSVTQSYIVNFERDDQATAPSGVELRTPFTDPDVIRFSLRIPSELKVKSGDDIMRKWILRTVGQDIGLASEITWRRKKAIQHGTGVEHAILKMAKNKGLTADAYLEQVYAEVKGIDSIPQL